MHNDSLEGEPDLESKRQAFIRFSQFQMTEDAEMIKEEIHDFLVEQGVFYGDPTRDGVSTPQILTSLRKNCLITDFPQALLEASIRRLLSKNHILEADDRTGFYVMSEGRFQTHEQEASEAESTRNNFVRTILRLVENKAGTMSPEQKQSVIVAYESFLAEFLMEHGHSVAAILVDIETGKEELDRIDNVKDVCQHTVSSKIEETRLREICVEVFINSFKEMEPKMQSFIESVSRKFFYMEIANMDPEVVALQKANFRDHIFYIDTNIIVPLLCKSDPLFTLMNNFISLAQGLGISLRLSIQTKDEFLRLLKGSNSRVSALMKKPTGVMKVLERIDDPFISDFGSQLETVTRSWKRWSGYDSHMRDFVQTLKNDYEIVLDLDPHLDIIENERFKEMSEYVSKANLRKSPVTVEHDSFHLLLIKALREESIEPDLLGSNVWFVTDDDSLKRTEKWFQDASQFDSSIQIEKIVGILSKFLFLETEEKRDMVSFLIDLLESKFPSKVDKIRVDDLIEVADEWMNYKELTTEEIVGVLANTTMQSNLARIRKAKKEGKRADDPKTLVIATLIGQIKQKLTNLEQKSSIEGAEAAKYRARILELESAERKLILELERLRQRKPDIIKTQLGDPDMAREQRYASGEKYVVCCAIFVILFLLVVGVVFVVYGVSSPSQIKILGVEIHTATVGLVIIVLATLITIFLIVRSFRK